MAEIKIEKKKPIWPWILLVVVLVVIGYFIYNYLENDDFNDDANTDDVENINGVMDSDSTSRDTVTAYDDSSYATRNLTEVMRDSSRFGTDTIYTNKALYDLAERSVSIAKKYNLETFPAVSNLEQYTMTQENLAIQTNQNPKNANGSEHFKTVSKEIMEVLETLESNHAPRLQQQLEALKVTSSKINGTLDLSKQQTTLQTFFRKAHELLNLMNS